ncbi:exonuclease [Cronobacter phage Dev-CD-23823]|uniref:DNA exonuclease n=1 Tax=Cronobacter phage Dev-CD-23823 TaxID=1712539 RepID=A0A0K8IX56_9CAUD|nr:exonuclease [Cronobacter phage Dev-CD-23823]CUH74597.1 DNA exonuclease [Cronobacter phage Dev-CD-23823]
MRERIAKVSPQFHRTEEASTLEVDADSLIYKVAATTKNLETAKRRLVSEALTLHFLADTQISRLHLTPKHCRKAGRFNVQAVKPYQGNRTAGKKPELVEPLRYVVGREQLKLPPEIQIIFNDVYEADDSVVMACHADPKAIYYSEDKDLDCLRNRKLCQHEMRVLPEVHGLGWLALKELSRSKKVVGRGPVFFWAQMLMGDTADNIKGITKANGTLCGASKTYALLQQFLNATDDSLAPASCLATCTEQDIARYVLGLYKDNEQNPWPEAWLLWLYRAEGYHFHRHMQELGLLDNSELGTWLKQQLALPWFIKEDK